jgi:type IV secretion system protein VirD4
MTAPVLAPLRSVAPTAPVLLAVVGVALLVALWVATQTIAEGAGYHRALGQALYAMPHDTVPRWRWVSGGLLGVGAVLAVASLGFGLRVRVAALTMLAAGGISVTATLGPVYDPTRAVAWARRFHGDARLEPLVTRAIYAGGSAFAIVLLGALTVGRRRERRQPSTSHGSARWGDAKSLVGPAGLIVGRAPEPTTKARGRTSPDGEFLRYTGDGHLLTIAPTRTGKGVGCVIPNLLTYPGSVIVTDPKGENFAVTARARRMMEQSVHALDPFGVLDQVPGFTGSAAINPMDGIDATSPDALDDARLLAEMLVVPAGRGGDSHFWDEEARALLSGLILHVASAAPVELRTLTHVRELLTLPPEPFALVIEEMLASPACDGIVARSAARLAQKAERERSSVISAAQSHTHFLDSPRMARVLGETTVPLEVLRSAPMSVYLVLPPARLEGYARWLRLMTGYALSAVTRQPGGRAAHRVLLLLDEFAHLGRMQPVERDIGLAAGYGVTFWLLLQDLAQLKATYADRWGTFLANCEVLQAFGTNDWETAELLSKLTGEATIQVASENRSRGVSRGHHAQRNEGEATTMAERGRRLLTPDEVLRMPASELLLFLRGQPAVRAGKLDYRALPTLAALADANPMHAGDAVATDVA